MIQANEQAIRQVVQEVLAQLGRRTGGARQQRPRQRRLGRVPHGRRRGGRRDATASRNSATCRWPNRAKAIACVYRICDEQAEELGRLELEETKIGRLDHKIEKLQDREARPGHRVPQAATPRSGDHGLTVTEYAPFGVIGAITPVTHSLPTLAGNVVNMLAAGNTVVFNPHPVGSADRLRRSPPLQPGHPRGDRTGEPDHDHRRADARNGRPDLRSPGHSAVGGDRRSRRGAGGPREQEAGDRRRAGQSAGRRR